MSTATRLALGLSLLVVSAVAFAGVGAAQARTGAEDLANIRTVQGLSRATDDLYAPSLDSLISGEFGQSVTFRVDSQVAYLINSARTHYLAATILPSGGVAVSSDSGRPVVCPEYTAECIAQVTADAELIALTPEWIAF